MIDPALTHLFPEGIYLIPETTSLEVTSQPSVSEDEKSVLEFSGNNDKGVIILYDTPSTLPGDEEAFLLKIMSAVGLTRNDIALLHITGDNTSWHTLPHTALLIFGCEKLPELPEAYYVPMRHKGVTWLRSAPLHQLMTDKTLKSQLWQGLKTMFGV
jgi:DNA polymerase III psi subunit